MRTNGEPKFARNCYESEEKPQGSLYRDRWNAVMDVGTPRRSTPCARVAVLLLYWTGGLDDSGVTGQVKELSLIFEKLFNYQTQITHLDTGHKQKLQLQVNAKIASFIAEHDEPDVLMIIYYNGRDRPGNHLNILDTPGFVDLTVCFPTADLSSSKSIDQDKSSSDAVLLNKSSLFLRFSHADILEIIDWYLDSLL